MCANKSFEKAACKNVDEINPRYQCCKQFYDCKESLKNRIEIGTKFAPKIKTLFVFSELHRTGVNAIKRFFFVTEAARA